MFLFVFQSPPSQVPFINHRSKTLTLEIPPIFTEAERMARTSATEGSQLEKQLLAFLCKDDAVEKTFASEWNLPECISLRAEIAEKNEAIQKEVAELMVEFASLKQDINGLIKNGALISETQKEAVLREEGFDSDSVTEKQRKENAGSAMEKVTMDSVLINRDFELKNKLVEKLCFEKAELERVSKEQESEVQELTNKVMQLAKANIEAKRTTTKANEEDRDAMVASSRYCCCETIEKLKWKVAEMEVRIREAAEKLVEAEYEKEKEAEEHGAVVKGLEEQVEAKNVCLRDKDVEVEEMRQRAVKLQKSVQDEKFVTNFFGLSLFKVYPSYYGSPVSTVTFLSWGKTNPALIGSKPFLTPAMSTRSNDSVL